MENPEKEDKKPQENTPENEQIFNTNIKVPEPQENTPEMAKNGDKRILWDLSPLDIEKFKIIESTNKSFSNAFNPRRNLTNAFLIELKRRCTGENHIILTISGLTGSGKSTVAQFIAKSIEKVNTVPFPENSENIQFTFEKLLERTPYVEKNGTLISDESVLQSGIGSIREKLDIMNLENTIRKSGINIIWVYPQENIKHFTAHFNLKTIAMNKELKLTKLALMYGEIYLGYVIFDITKILISDLWKNYNLRKDEFISDILERKQLRKDYSAMAKQLLKMLSHTGEIRHLKGVANTKIILRLYVPHLAESELDTIARYIILYKDNKDFYK